MDDGCRNEYLVLCYLVDDNVAYSGFSFDSVADRCGIKPHNIWLTEVWFDDVFILASCLFPYTTDGVFNHAIFSTHPFGLRMLDILGFVCIKVLLMWPVFAHSGEDGKEAI